VIKYNFDVSFKRPLVMGVDPGLSGAICVMHIKDNAIVDMIDMPVIKKKSKARKQGYLSEVDMYELARLVDLYTKHVRICVIEEPGAMPNQGLSSTFRFGKTCGQLQGMLIGYGVLVVPIKPMIWKPMFGLSTKEDSMSRASLEFPDFKDLWKLKKHNDRAEAAILALYAKKVSSLR